MKTLTLLLFLLAAPFVSAQEVTLDNITTFEGKTVTLCAQVSGTHTTKGEKKVIYLNFGGAFPNHTFTVVIFEKDWANFSYAITEKLDKTVVCVTGLVAFYKGRPQMILQKESEIVVK